MFYQFGALVVKNQENLRYILTFKKTTQTCGSKQFLFEVSKSKHSIFCFCFFFIIVPWLPTIKKTRINIYTYTTAENVRLPLSPQGDIGSAPQVIISSRDAFSDKDYNSAKASSVRISKWRRKYWLSFEGKKVFESVDKFILHCWKVHCLTMRDMCHKSVAYVLFIFALGIFSGKFYEFVIPKR